MADDAFALSPISARASLPSDGDYEAISVAFMETTRGRWFLTEYAKRNRNADTRMVLDAVARIEEALAIQRPAAPEQPSDEMLASVRAAVAAAKVSAISAIDGYPINDTMSPIRRGVRVIREISWRLREVGADGRICDLIESQVADIEESCSGFGLSSLKPAVEAAFDVVTQHVDGLSKSNIAKAAAPQVAPKPQVTPEETKVAKEAAVAEQTAFKEALADEPLAEALVQPEISADLAAVEAPPSPSEAVPVDLEIIEHRTADIETEETSRVLDELPPVPTVHELDDTLVRIAETVTSDNESASDEAQDTVLDMIAFEMAAADPADYETSEAPPASLAMPATEITSQPDLEAQSSPPPFERTPHRNLETLPPTSMLKETSHPDLEARSSAVQSTQNDAPTIVKETTLSLLDQLAQATASEIRPVPTQSLGASLLATGVVRKPKIFTGPLATVGRMTQAEKIAFFS